MDSAVHLLESIGEAYLLYDADWRCTYVNAAAESLLGASRSDLLGFVLWEICPDLTGRFECECRSVMRDRVPRAFDYFRSTSGIWYHVRVSAAVTGGVVVHATDINRTRQLELRAEELNKRQLEMRRQMERTEMRLRFAEEAANLGIFEYDPHSGVAVLSPGFCGLLGRAPDTVLTFTDWFEAIHPDDAAKIKAVLANPGNQMETEYRVVWPDGTVRWLAGRSRRFRFTGTTDRFFGVTVDITERKQAEDRLRESELRFRTLCETAPIGIFCGADQGCTYHNPELDRMLGLGGPGDLPVPSGIVDEADREHVLSTFTSAMEQGSDWRLDFRVRLATGNLAWVSAAARFSRGETGASYVGTLWDITERVESQQHAARMLADLQTTHKLLEQQTAELMRSNEDLQRFAYAASHDLREPLRTIRSYVQLLRRRLGNELDESTLHYVDFIESAVRRLSDLTQGLLDYSTAADFEARRSPVDLNRVMEDVRVNLGAAIEQSGARITSEQLPTVLGDEGRLLQVLQNLTVNAIKYRGEAPPEVRVSALQEGKEWVVTVADNGAGFDEKFATSIFDLFFRLKSRVRTDGAGIGLALVRRIVERHGGRVWATSRLNEGSQFRFTLPAE